MATAKILSYPRSGNHLVRFLIEYSLGRPTKGCGRNREDIPLYLNHYPDKSVLAHVDGTKPFSFEKVHYSRNIHEKPSQLIFIVRDPTEAIFNHMRLYNPTARFHAGVVAEMKQFLDNVVYFMQYTGPKLLLYYEDLIDPQKNAKSLQTLGKFIGANATVVETMIQQKTYLYEQCRNATNRAWDGFKSNAQKQYYVKRTKVEIRNRFKKEWRLISTNYSQACLTLLAHYPNK